MNKLMFTHRQTNELFKIYINGLLHMTINKLNFNTIRSWKIPKELDPDPFFIEVQSNGSTTRYQYDTMEKWSNILKLLDTLDLQKL